MEEPILQIQSVVHQLEIRSPEAVLVIESQDPPISLETGGVEITTTLEVPRVVTVLGVAQRGPAGASGGDGLSAYEIAVDNGFIGTEEEWLISLGGNSFGLDGYLEDQNVIIDGGLI